MSEWWWVRSLDVFFWNFLGYFIELSLTILVEVSNLLTVRQNFVKCQFIKKSHNVQAVVLDR